MEPLAKKIGFQKIRANSMNLMLVQEGCVKLGARALASTRDRVARGRPRARAHARWSRGRARCRGLRQGPSTWRLLQKPTLFFCHGAGAPFKFVIWEIKLRSQNELKLLKVKSHSENVISEPTYKNQLPTPSPPRHFPIPLPSHQSPWRRGVKGGEGWWWLVARKRHGKVAGRVLGKGRARARPRGLRQVPSTRRLLKKTHVFFVMARGLR